MSSLIRPANWDEVDRLFHGHGGSDQAMKNIAGWAKRYGIERWFDGLRSVTLQSWSNVELGELMDQMSKFEPRLVDDHVKGVNNAQLPPRLDGLPITLVRFGERYGIIDGKHRLNRWRHQPGNYAVLVIHA